MPSAKSHTQVPYTVYVLHFRVGQAMRHYTGYTARPIAMRLREHFHTTRGHRALRTLRTGTGAGLAVSLFQYETARAARRHELRIKRDGARLYCATCSLRRAENATTLTNNRRPA